MCIAYRLAFFVVSPIAYHLFSYFRLYIALYRVVNMCLILKLLLYWWHVRSSLPITILSTMWFYNYVVRWRSVFINKTTATCIAVDSRLFAFQSPLLLSTPGFYSQLSTYIYTLNSRPIKTWKSVCIKCNSARSLMNSPLTWGHAAFRHNVMTVVQVLFIVCI
jgi:hypothetical protein